MCHNDGVGHETIKLKQLDISDVDLDTNLFQCLRDEYMALRKHWWLRISPWSLKSIRFVRFELYENDLVDINKLDDVPPSEMNDEYRHRPPNAPEVCPPLGSTLLLHLLGYPACAGRQDTTEVESKVRHS